MFDFWKDYCLFTDEIVSVPAFSTKIKIPNTVIRIREYQSSFLNNRKELGYPQEKYCKKLGRANIPKHPVFYGSFTKAIAIEEYLKTQNVRPKKIIVSSWKFDNNREYDTVIFMQRNTPGETTIDSIFDLTHQKIEERFVSRYPLMTEDKESTTLLWDLLSDQESTGKLFLEDDGYFVSSLISYELLYKSRNNNQISSKDIIIYPSVINPVEANLAIHPSVVDNYLELISSEIVEV